MSTIAGDTIIIDAPNDTAIDCSADTASEVQDRSITGSCDLLYWQ